MPGGVVQGEVRIQGGSVDQQIEGLSVGLQARVEVEGGDQEYKQDIEFTKQRLGGAFEVQAGAVHVVPFGLEIPWETPVTTFAGQQLHGMNIGVTTELEIARARGLGRPGPDQRAPAAGAAGDPGRLRPARLPLQERGHGARAHPRDAADSCRSTRRSSSSPPQQYRGLNQVELTFVADDREMDVVLEMDKKPGLFSEGSDSYQAFKVGLQRLPGDRLGGVPQPVARRGRRASQLALRLGRGRTVRTAESEVQT